MGCFGQLLKKKRIETLKHDSFRFLNIATSKNEATCAMVQEGTAHDAEKRVKRLPQYNKKSITSQYCLGEIIGVGGFSMVRNVTRKRTGEEFACKIMKLPKQRDDTHLNCMSREAMFNEIEIACKVHCSYIACVEEFFVSKSKIYVVLDLMRGGILLDDITSREQQRYTEEEAKCIFRQVLEGISYLHTRKIAHRDLKLQNLMLVNEVDLSHIKIIDMGLAKQITCVTNTNCGSPLYVAPEILSRSSCGHGLAVDMWSAGVILFLLLGGYSPFYDDHEYQLFQNIETCNYSFDDPVWNDVSHGAKDLIARCLLLDPAKRMTVMEALNHHWFHAAPLYDTFDLSLYANRRPQALVGSSRLPPMAIDADTEEESSRTSTSCASWSNNHDTSDFISEANYNLIRRYTTNMAA